MTSGHWNSKVLPHNGWAKYHENFRRFYRYKYYGQCCLVLGQNLHFGTTNVMWHLTYVPSSHLIMHVNTMYFGSIPILCNILWSKHVAQNWNQTKVHCIFMQFALLVFPYKDSFFASRWTHNILDSKCVWNREQPTHDYIQQAIMKKN